MDAAEMLKLIRDTWISLGVEVEAYLNARSQTVSLPRISVQKSHRNEGLGTKAMKDLCQFADEFKLAITLSPSTDFGASSVSRLKKFYERFGFVQNKGRNKDFAISDSMYRVPR